MVRINTLENTIAGITRKSDGYYIPIYAQCGGSRIFWSYAGKTREDAVEAAKNIQKTNHSTPLPADVKKKFVDDCRNFRSKETAAFNTKYDIAFYTDYPWRFSGEAKDNATAELFNASGLRYRFIQSEEILAGKLPESKVIFCPGGFGYFPSKKMGGAIKEFVRNGGGFFGFCAGAFLPLKDFLGMCDSTFAYFREQGYPDVMLNPADPLAQGIESSVPTVCYALTKKTPQQRRFTVRIKMMRANGPLMIRQGKDKAAAYFDSTENFSPIIRSQYGKGRVVAVSPHPDIDIAKMLEMTNEKAVIANYRLFKNIALYCAGM